MKKLFLGSLNAATYGYIGFALIIWVLNYFQIDISAILDWLKVPADFFGATGLVFLSGKSSYQIIKYVLTKLETRTAKLIGDNQKLVLAFTVILKEVLDKTSMGVEFNTAVKSRLDLVLEFEKILAIKNMSSLLIDDDVKIQLKNFIASLELMNNETI